MLSHAINQKWTIAEHSQALSQVLVQDPQIHTLFSGATSLEAVADKIVELVLVETPDLIKERKIDQWSLLPVLSIAFQAVVIKSLLGESLCQAEHLIIPLTHHFAQKPKETPPSVEQEKLKDQICALHQKWQHTQAQQRQDKRNMLK